MVAAPVADSVFPGFVDLPPVHLPHDVNPTSVTAAGDQVWVSGVQIDPGTGGEFPRFLHARAGGQLEPPSGSSVGTSVVAGASHTFLVAYAGDGHQVLQVRDTTTGALQREDDLTVRYGADSALVQVTGDGTGPLVLLMTKSKPAQEKPGGIDNRISVGVFGSEGSLTRVTPFLSQPTYQTSSGTLTDGFPPTVRLLRGVPRSLVFSRSEVDVATGAVRPLRFAGTPEPPAGSAVGEVGGHLVWQVEQDNSPFHNEAQVSDLDGGSLTETGTRGDLILADGHLFRALTLGDPQVYGDPANEQRAQELDPVTLQPVGPLGLPFHPFLTLHGGTFATHTPASMSSSKGLPLGGVITVAQPAPLR